MILTNTDSPQGLCIITTLNIFYTYNCRSSHDDRFLVTFADGSALISLFTGPENNHGVALKGFVDWCDDSCLELNECTQNQRTYC